MDDANWSFLAYVYKKQPSEDDVVRQTRKQLQRPPCRKSQCSPGSWFSGSLIGLPDSIGNVVAPPVADPVLARDACQISETWAPRNNIANPVETAWIFPGRTLSTHSRSHRADSGKELPLDAPSAIQRYGAAGGSDATLVGFLRSRREFIKSAAAAYLSIASSPLALGAVEASAADGTPEQIHLTWGDDPSTSSVFVSWASPAPRRPARCRRLLGSSPGPWPHGSCAPAQLYRRPQRADRIYLSRQARRATAGFGDPLLGDGRQRQ